MKGYTKIEKIDEVARDLNCSGFELMCLLQDFGLDICTRNEKNVLRELSYLKISYKKNPVDGQSVTTYGDVVPTIMLELKRRQSKETDDVS